MSEQPGFQLQLLGGFGLRSLRQTDRAIVVSAKKARTLLAYVAMQEPMQLSRDRLATLLWPERIDRQARQNLRQCIASLRHDLAGVADELLMIDGETVKLRDGVAVDARQLRKLANADAPADLHAAAALYRGEFLCGLETPGEEFGAWAAAERAQLDSIAGAILSKAASLADHAGDGAKALQVSARLIALDALREDWQRLVLRISARHLGRDQALLQAKKFVALLRTELDVEPEPETVALIDQIKAGAIASLRSRSVAVDDTPYRSSPPPARDDRSALPSPPQKVAAGGRTMIASAAIAAAVALLVASLSAVLGPGARMGFLGPGFRGAAIDRSTVPILVLPFQSEAAATADLARELTENLLTSMTRFSGLTVVDGRAIGGAHDPAAEAAGRFGIRFSAWGSVRRQGSAVRLNVGLSDAGNHTVAWADDVTASDDRIAALATELPRRFARDFQVQAAYAQAPPPPLYAALASAYALDGRLAESRQQVRLMKQAADPAALDRLLSAAARNDGAHSSRYWQGLRLAANNTL